MKEIAIIGPTASGKSDLAFRLAKAHDALILSIDSLSIYKEIDIASAKPSRQELAEVRHLGIDHLTPDQHFSVSTFIDCYHTAKRAAMEAEKDLIIVGGSGFYLKTLLEGLSPIPEYSDETLDLVDMYLQDLPSAFSMLNDADPLYMQAIKPTDAYRIEKLLLLYLQSGQIPSEWFAAHPPVPIIDSLELYEIDVDRTLLRERIRLRTEKMLQEGLIDEVTHLEYHYGRAPNSMKAIGIIEVLSYLDGMLDKTQMNEAIITHTSQLAKRQQTFNRHQFTDRRLLPIEAIHTEVSKSLSTP